MTVLLIKDLEKWNELENKPTHTPLFINKSKAVCYSIEPIEADFIECLGDYEEIFADSAKNKKYKAVYPYDKPIKFEDEEGNIITKTRPKEVGMFAGQKSYSERLQEAKEKKLQEINAKYNKTIAVILKVYPEREVDTFYKQLEEAKAFLKDETVKTPFIDKVAERRGLTKKEIADKIVVKDEQFSTISGDLTGLVQVLREQINNAKTIAEVEQVRW